MNRNALAVCLSLGCLCSLSVQAADEKKLIEEARYVAKSLPPKLINYLQSSIQKEGTEHALTHYSHLSPKVLADAAEETGWEIRQVSLKNRSPKAKPDAFEREMLAQFEKRIAAGEPPINIDKGMIVKEGGKTYYRYMQPMMMQAVCLDCHGPQDKLKPEVKTLLKELYPNDKATGYTEGMMRGALSLKKPL